MWCCGFKAEEDVPCSRFIKTAIALEEAELLELEQIITDEDQKAALDFLTKTVYTKAARSQGARLKSHLYTGGDPVEKFKMG